MYEITGRIHNRLTVFLCRFSEQTLSVANTAKLVYM